MLKFGLITSNPQAAEAIEQFAQETSTFRVEPKLSVETSIHEIMRMLRVHDPEILLLDLNNWATLEPILTQIRAGTIRGRMIGFLPTWTYHQQVDFEHAGIVQLIAEPFSPLELDAAVYKALHQDVSKTRSNLVAFVPAKAGGGCSTAALNAAGAFSTIPGKRVLLLEGDGRSGTFSMMLNVKNRLGLQDALQKAGEITVVEWQQFHAHTEGIDLLLADPARPSPRSSWAEYFQLLRFLDKYYDFIVVDLPEVVNDATAELVRTAQNILVVCTPEILSLKLANLRCLEIEAYGVPKERIQVVVTRWKRDGISIEDVEKSVGRPVYATLANDYSEVRNAILEARLVGPSSPFGKDCSALARKLGGLAEEPKERSAFGLLRKLAR